MNVVLLCLLIGVAQASSIPWSLQGCATPLPPLPVIKDMHAELRSKFTQAFLSNVPNGYRGIVFLYGNTVQTRTGTADTEVAFRQESHFLYLTGVDKPDFAFAYDVENSKSILFAPKRDEYYALWNGEVMTLEQIQELYGTDEVIYTEEIQKKLTEITNNGEKIIYLLPYQELPDFTNVDKQYLLIALGASRVTKTASELVLLRIAAKVSSDAHINLMKDSEVGLYEYNYGGSFVYYSTSCGLIHQAYQPIVGSGNRSAILHYNVNSAQTLDGDFILVDAGAEFRGYATDITRTYPVNGKFSPLQTLIYVMVEEIVLEVERSMRPGMSWRAFQTLASHMVCRKMLEAGFIQGSIDELIENQMWYYFFPHGLGHSVGLDVHDPGLKDLLEENMVITVEPGIYFNRAFINSGLNDPEVKHFFVEDKIFPVLNQNFGGVRIEDTVVVTKNGAENIATVPKSIPEIELLMRK